MIQEILFVAWVASALAVIISMHSIIQHASHYTQPNIQRKIIRILLMCPVYAADSFLSLAVHSLAPYADTLRDAYEAYVIYAFLALLIEYLGGDEHLQDMLATRPNQRHPFPFGYCLPNVVVSDPDFLRRIKQGVLQFTVIKPLLAVVTIILNLTGLYGEGGFSQHSGYLWIIIINNVSILCALLVCLYLVFMCLFSVSMYSLVLFYMVTSKDLRPYSPLPKFLVIKAVIFFSFWQGVAVAILAKQGFISPMWGWSTAEVGVYVQDCLICVEMLLAAIAHRYAFPYEPFSYWVRESANNSRYNSPRVHTHTLGHRHKHPGYLSFEDRRASESDDEYAHARAHAYAYAETQTHAHTESTLVRQQSRDPLLGVHPHRRASDADTDTEREAHTHAHADGDGVYPRISTIAVLPAGSDDRAHGLSLTHSRNAQAQAQTPTLSNTSTPTPTSAQPGSHESPLSAPLSRARVASESSPDSYSRAAHGQARGITPSQSRDQIAAGTHTSSSASSSSTIVDKERTAGSRKNSFSLAAPADGHVNARRHSIDRDRAPSPFTTTPVIQSVVHAVSQRDVIGDVRSTFKLKKTAPPVEFTDYRLNPPIAATAAAASAAGVAAGASGSGSSRTPSPAPSPSPKLNARAADT